MPFSLGAIELLLLAAIVVPVALLYALGHRRYRIGVAMLVCAVLAALLTHADVLSMLLLFTAFAGVFLLGLRYRIDPSTNAT